MVIKTKYNVGDIAYIKNDPKQRTYDIVGIQVKPGGVILYDLDYMGSTLEMYEFQISSEKDVVKTLTASDENDD